MTEIQVSIDIVALSCIQECPIQTAARPTLAPARNILLSVFEPHLVMVFTGVLGKSEVEIGKDGYQATEKDSIFKDVTLQAHASSGQPSTMERSPLVERVQDLTDLELAILLSLVAGEHCIIQTESSVLESLEHELRLVQ